MHDSFGSLWHVAQQRVSVPVLCSPHGRSSRGSAFLSSAALTDEAPPSRLPTCQQPSLPATTVSVCAHMQVGAETFRMCRQHVDGVLLVDNAAISAAIKDVFEESRCILEPAGAVALAGAKAWLTENGHKVSCTVYTPTAAPLCIPRALPVPCGMYAAAVGGGGAL